MPQRPLAYSYNSWASVSQQPGVKGQLSRIINIICISVDFLHYFTFIFENPVSQFHNIHPESSSIVSMFINVLHQYLEIFGFLDKQVSLAPTPLPYSQVPQLP